MKADAMKAEFKQAVLDSHTFQLMDNGIYIAAFTDMSARSHLYVDDPHKFLELVQRDVTQKFGPFLEVKYFDADAFDLIDDIEAAESFYLLVTLTSNYFYSKTVH